MTDESNHEHDHPEETTQTFTSNLEEFISRNPLEINVFKTRNELNSKFQNTCRRIVTDAQKFSDSVNTRTNFYVTLARKKLHQGKKWSRGFVEALLLDFAAAKLQYDTRAAKTLSTENSEEVKPNGETPETLQVS